MPKYVFIIVQQYKKLAHVFIVQILFYCEAEIRVAKPLTISLIYLVTITVCSFCCCVKDVHRNLWKKFMEKTRFSTITSRKQMTDRSQYKNTPHGPHDPTLYISKGKNTAPFSTFFFIVHKSPGLTNIIIAYIR